jgi:hypothetical protein
MGTIDRKRNISGDEAKNLGQKQPIDESASDDAHNYLL